MTVFCVLSKHRGFNKHIWQAFHSWRAQDDTVCKQYACTGGKQVYSIIQLIDYSQDTCYPTMKNGARTPRIRVGPRISNSRQYGIYRSWGSSQTHENITPNHPHTHTYMHTHKHTDTHTLVATALENWTQIPRTKYYEDLKNSECLVLSVEMWGRNGVGGRLISEGRALWAAQYSVLIEFWRQKFIVFSLWKLEVFLQGFMSSHLYAPG